MMAVQGKIWANNNLLNLCCCSCSEAENTNNSKWFFLFVNHIYTDRKDGQYCHIYIRNSHHYFFTSYFSISSK